MCVFSAAKPPKKHTLVLFEAAGGGLKKNILFRTRYLVRKGNFFGSESLVGSDTIALEAIVSLGVILPASKEHAELRCPSAADF